MGAVLFAVLSYTLPLPGDDSGFSTQQTRCDAAVVQVLGSPSTGRVETSLHGSAGAVITIPNVESSCEPVGHYRLGIAAALLLIAAALGAFVVVNPARRVPRTSTEPLKVDNA